MLKVKALVYGWYSARNIGDLLFKQAFQQLFPDLQFTFVDSIKLNDVRSHDILIIGGGSFLFAEPSIDQREAVLTELERKSIYYIGVGVEDDVHPIHQEWMKKARIIAVRSVAGAERAKGRAGFLTEVLSIPDIVSSLTEKAVLSPVIPHSVLILPNAEVVPKWSGEHWKHNSWNYFKGEFAQFLDLLKEDKHSITFAPLCTNSNMSDAAAAAEIINQMRYRNYNASIQELPVSMVELTTILSRYEVIISQRYHGVVLSEMVSRPCLSIAHHDKLRNATATAKTISYYGVNKQLLKDAFDEVKSIIIEPIVSHPFEELKRAFYSSLSGAPWIGSLESKTGRSK